MEFLIISGTIATLGHLLIAQEIPITDVIKIFVKKIKKYIAN